MVSKYTVYFQSGNVYLTLQNLNGTLEATPSGNPLRDPLALRDWLTENFDPEYVPPLKPCPFCNRPDSVGYFSTITCVKCTHCFARGPIGSKAEASKMWNARHGNG